MCSDLIIHDVEDSVMLALQQRAKLHDRSIEEELRDILIEVLKKPARRSFAEVLASMPNVGEDDDFNRRNH